MWCVKIKTTKHSSSAQAGGEREQEGSKADHCQMRSNAEAMGQRRETAGWVLQRCSTDRNWGGCGRGCQQELLRRQGALGGLRFCLQKVWGGDGHPCTFPSPRDPTGDSQSVLVPSTYMKQNAHRTWASSETLRKALPREGEGEVTPSAPPTATQQHHAYPLTENLSRSGPLLWSETTVLKQHITMLLPVAMETQHCWPQRGAGLSWPCSPSKVPR